jgi:hypothetical protein
VQDHEHPLAGPTKAVGAPLVLNEGARTWLGAADAW